ncbi:hypothetical protein K1719_018111 [Acacia pycnantha]|nr:hypothetical protein K1719_018111 [Acacia pycnantha]
MASNFSILENLTEDSFEFTSSILFSSTRGPPLRINVFGSPSIISCEEFLRDVLGFLRRTFHNVLPETLLQSLTSDVTSEALRILEQAATSETTHHHRLIPLPTYFLVSYEDIQGMNEVNNNINSAIEQSIQQFYMVPASKEAIASLKKFKVHGGVKVEPCTICLENFDHDDDLLIMPCEHIFHNSCIVRWLETCHRCPLCRFQMAVE